MCKSLLYNSQVKFEPLFIKDHSGKILIYEAKFDDGLIYIERGLDFIKKIYEGGFDTLIKIIGMSKKDLMKNLH